MSTRNCVHCGKEYTLYKGKPGLINECTTCGRDTQDGQVRRGDIIPLKGVMTYEHKTAGEIQILEAKSAENHIRIASRIGKRSNLGKARGTES